LKVRFIYCPSPNNPTPISKGSARSKRNCGAAPYPGLGPLREALDALGAGAALMRRSPSLAGMTLPIRARRMTFRERPTPARTGRSILGRRL
jgi:hypothetical protein